MLLETGEIRFLHASREYFRISALEVDDAECQNGVVVLRILLQDYGGEPTDRFVILPRQVVPQPMGGFAE